MRQFPEAEVGITGVPIKAKQSELGAVQTSAEATTRASASAPRPIHVSGDPGVRIYQGNSLELLDSIAEQHPDGLVDMIFADPPAGKLMLLDHELDTRRLALATRLGVTVIWERAAGDYALLNPSLDVRLAGALRLPASPMIR